MSNVLVTGGTGYIGAHCCVALIEAGYHPVALDNLVNSSAAVLDRIERITGFRPPFVKGDVRDRAAVSSLLADWRPVAVMHFAGLKSVAESVRLPLDYFDANVHGTIALLKAMDEAGITTFIFSSSATVYGSPDSAPVTEDAAKRVANPYGRSKLMAEEVLEDLATSDPRWRIARLRYFNPVGAHPSGLMGEDPRGTPNNLMPYIAQVAVGRRERLAIFGGDYPTRDGTGVRDYIHVMDIAEGHLAALEYLRQMPGLISLNLGTGSGLTVREVVAAFERASGVTIPVEIVPRRPGDVAECYADPTLAARRLGWSCKRSLDEMCADAWRWQSQNPDGYDP